jgi:hypothetical protein
MNGLLAGSLARDVSRTERPQETGRVSAHHESFGTENDEKGDP